MYRKLRGAGQVSNFLPLSLPHSITPSTFLTSLLLSVPSSLLSRMRFFNILHLLKLNYKNFFQSCFQPWQVTSTALHNNWNHSIILSTCLFLYAILVISFNCIYIINSTLLLKTRNKKKEQFLYLSSYLSFLVFFIDIYIFLVSFL